MLGANHRDDQAGCSPCGAIVIAVTAAGHGIGGTTVKLISSPFRGSGRNVDSVVTGRADSARVKRELLDDRVREQIPGQFGDGGHRVLVRGPVKLHLEPLSLPDPEHLPEPQTAARAGDGLTLRIMYLGLEHDFHDHPGHVSSWVIRAYIVC